MPIEKPTNNLYRIRELSIMLTGGEYILSMNAGHAKACVLCISRLGNVRREDLSLTEGDLNTLYNGGKIQGKDYTLQGISGQQLTALSQYRGLELQPPVYVQAWAMTLGQNGKILFIPDDPNEVERQRTVVPVYYRVSFSEQGLIVSLEEMRGYRDGDLLYRFKDRMPIPIPRSWIGKPIPLRNRTGCEVIPATAVAQNYLKR
ncbi:MAG: hypothetical protein IKM59_04045 [Oscillospiraceae bacterium]|nr:hypothetical protein [Oscillospiraceae bacterium]